MMTELERIIWYGHEPEAKEAVRRLIEVVKAAENLTNKANVVTAYYRHGAAVSYASVDDLYMAQLKIEEALKKLRGEDE